MFELNDEIIRQVIFAMENQTVRCLVERDTGKVVRRDSVPAEFHPDPALLDPESAYFHVPDWTSADGFQLMEAFVGQLQNEPARAHLHAVLEAGRGVFRAFKDYLRTRPEVQELFFQFKFRTMRGVVVEWYNTLRELAGLDLLELGHDEEADDLAPVEFAVRFYTEVLAAGADFALPERDRRAFDQAHAGKPAPFVAYALAMRERTLPPFEADRNRLFVAYSPLGEPAGFLWAEEVALPGDMLAAAPVDASVTTSESGGAKRLLVVHQLYVEADYRGLGIAVRLIEAFAARYPSDGRTMHLVAVPGDCSFMQAAWRRIGCTVYSDRLFAAS